MAIVEERASLPANTVERYRKWLQDEFHKAAASDPGRTSSGEDAQRLLQSIHERSQMQLPENIKIQVFSHVLEEALGFGPIQGLIHDPTVTEIMVNGARSVYVERNGKLEKTKIVFSGPQAVLDLINQIITPLGRSVDSDHPTVDARLPDGSRVNAVIPPVAIDGPGLTIRKFAKEKLKIQDLVGIGSVTEAMAKLLEACVVARLNVLISGGTGSGKTTLLNVLSSFVPENERIVTIEDSAELQLHQDHVFRLEIKPPSQDGKGEVTIRDLVRNALRMRPDRIIVGEVRGGEAIDMLQAMNTGHDGSLTTLHANSPRDAISRLETLVLMAGLGLPLRTVKEQIASAIDLIVQQARLRDGNRKVVSITEIVGMEGETIVLSELFNFKETGVNSQGIVQGDLRPTGLRPMFTSRLESAGFKLPALVFGAGKVHFNQQKRRGES